MGHMYPENISKRIIDQLKKHKRITLKSFCDDAVAKRVGVSCAEGVLKEWYIIAMAYMECLDLHLKQGIVEPVLETKAEKTAWRLWDRSGDIDDDKRRETFDNTKVRLKPGWHNKTIRHLRSVTH